jgi:MarR family transcriptional regulator, organic hydroperoxide resistance regulator
VIKRLALQVKPACLAIVPFAQPGEVVGDRALGVVGGLAPGEIARRLGVATATIVNTATRMEEAGLVARRPDPADARLVRLYLTDRGRSAREPVRAVRAALEQRATATLTATERDHLSSALAKIIAQLQDGAD